MGNDSIISQYPENSESTQGDEDSGLKDVFKICTENLAQIITKTFRDLQDDDRTSKIVSGACRIYAKEASHNFTRNDILSESIDTLLGKANAEKILLETTNGMGQNILQYLRANSQSVFDNVKREIEL